MKSKYLEFRDPKVTVEFIRSLTDEELLERVYESATCMTMRVIIQIQDLAYFYYKKKEPEVITEVEVIKPKIVLIEGS